MNSIPKSSAIFEDDYMLRSCGSVTTTPDISLTELVANAWDAGAMHVKITIPDELGSEIIVEDDGIGMTNEQFWQRWMTLRYDRKKKQGNTVEFPTGISEYVRHAYGRNGIGRHGMLCFSDCYTIETWRDGLCNKYDITVSAGDSPFMVTNHSSFEKEGHGTKLSAFVHRRLPQVAEMMDVISARYLYDPRFEVKINDLVVDFSKHKGLIEKNDITLANNIKFSVTIFDSTKTSRKSQQHGLAFWVCGRLVGMPSWSMNDITFLDGRLKAAKRYTIVLETDDLIDEVLPDWTGFKRSELIKVMLSEVEEYIVGLLSRIMSEQIDDVRTDIIHKNLGLLVDLPVKSQREISAFIEEVTVKHPIMNQEFLQTAVKAIINVEKSRRGEQLLSLLGSMDSEAIEKLTELLSNWDIRDIVLVMAEIDKRMTVIEAIRRLHDDPAADELNTLHPLVLHSRWLFGAEFDSPMFTSNESLNTVFKKLFKDNEYDTSQLSNPRKRPDIVVLNRSSIKAVCTDRSDGDSGVMKPDQVLIVEIKRGKSKLGLAEVMQGLGYMNQIRKSGVLHGSATIRVYIVGAAIGDISSEPTIQGVDRLNVVIYGHLIDTALTKLLRLKEHLSSHYDRFGDESLVERALRQTGVQMKL